MRRTWLVSAMMASGACASERLPCRITLQPELRVGADSGPLAVGVAPGVSPVLRDSSRLVVDLSPNADPVLWRLPPQGAPVPVARRGEGPGELTSAGRFVGFRSDSLVLTDPARLRLVVLAPDGGPVRSVSLRVAVYDAVALSGGRFLGATTRGDSLAVVLLDSVGRVTQALGSAVAGGRSWVGRGGPDSVWLVASAGREVRRWTSGAVHVLRPQGAQWVRALETEGDRPPVGRPMTTGVWADEAGVWVGSVIRDARWESAIEYAPPGDALHRAVERVVNPVHAWDGLLELLHPATGRVLARVTTDTAVYPLYAGYVGQPTETPGGAPALQLYRATAVCGPAA